MSGHLSALAGCKKSLKNLLVTVAPVAQKASYDSVQSVMQLSVAATSNTPPLADEVQHVPPRAKLGAVLDVDTVFIKVY